MSKRHKQIYVTCELLYEPSCCNHHLIVVCCIVTYIYTGFSSHSFIFSLCHWKMWKYQQNNNIIHCVEWSDIRTTLSVRCKLAYVDFFFCKIVTQACQIARRYSDELRLFKFWFFFKFLLFFDEEIQQLQQSFCIEVERSKQWMLTF